MFEKEKLDHHIVLLSTDIKLLDENIVNIYTNMCDIEILFRNL